MLHSEEITRSLSSQSISRRNFARFNETNQRRVIWRSGIIVAFTFLMKHVCLTVDDKRGRVLIHAAGSKPEWSLKRFSSRRECRKVKE